MSVDARASAPDHAARAALDAGRVAEAAALYRRLATAAPQDARWRIGLARCAVAALQPEAALQAIDLAETLAARPNPAWGLLRGQALLLLGEVAAAEASLRVVAAALPGHLGARLALVRVLRRAGRAAEALDALEPVVDTPAAESSAIAAQRIALLVTLGRLAEARPAFEAAVDAATGTTELQTLFALTAPLHGEGAPAASGFRRIRARLAALPPCPLLSVRLRFALGDLSRFRSEADALLRSGFDGPLAPTLRSVLDALARPMEQDRLRPKVFVIGLSKTATSSLDVALGLLGFGAAHFANPISGRMLAPADAALFDALSDIPVVDMMEMLAATYPRARFILTERPAEAWMESFRAHHLRHHGTADFAAFRTLCQAKDGTPHGARWRAMQQRIYTRHADLESARAAHVARVEQLFADAPNRLLRFNVFAGDGWAKLCDYLGRPVPAQPFPHANAAPRLLA
jgi:hypothetical protein